MGLNLKLKLNLSVGMTPINNAPAYTDCVATDDNLIEIVDNNLFSEYVTAQIALANGESITVADKLDVIRFLQIETTEEVQLVLRDFTPETHTFKFERMFLMFGEWDELTLQGINTERDTLVKVIAIGGPVNP